VYFCVFCIQPLKRCRNVFCYLAAIFGIFIGTACANAQPSAGIPVWGSDANFNFIFAHTPDVQRLADTNPMRFELSYAIQTLGHKPWQHWYRLPRYGVAFGHLDFADPARLGTATSLLAFMEVANRRRGAWSTHFRVATGLAWLTRPFDLSENRKNLFYSQRLNPAMQGSWNVLYQITPQVQLSTGMVLTHFSNGSFTLPNKGINVLGFQAGIRYQVRLLASPLRRADTAMEAYKQGWQHAVRLAGSAKRMSIGDTYYGVLTGGYWGQYRYTAKGSWLFGADFTQSPGIQEETGKSPLQGIDFFRASVVVGHETHINRISMINYAGVYVFTPVFPPSRLYFSNGLRYRFASRWSATWLLRIHKGVADFIEYGLVYTM
jgi:hypothetical protein